MNIPFDDIKARVSQGYVPALCQRWLPGGSVKGDWWLVRVPWREDKTPSLGVHLSSGNWKDFGRTEGGDVIELYQRLKGCDVFEAAEAVAICVGHNWRRAA